MRLLFALLLIFSVFNSPEAFGLDSRENEVLHMGRISSSRLIWGGILGTVPGFGLGHFVQGRYRGGVWLITAGEAVGVGLMAAEMGTNGGVFPGNGILGILGLTTFGVFKVWELYDVWFGAMKHNSFHDQTKIKMERTQNIQIIPWITRPGVTVAWTF